MARATEQKPSPILEAMRRLRADAASYRGIWSWITTVDHKRIGIMYGVTALAFFVLGGIEALLLLNLGAPGMTLFRMPLFVWMTLVASFLIVFAMPVITVALFELLFDRLFDANFFNCEKGGAPLLWRHTF